MKLLFIIPEYKPHPGGGTSTYYINLLHELKNKGVELDVIVGSAFVNGSKNFYENGISVELLKSEYFQKYMKIFSKFRIFPYLHRHISAAWGIYEQAKNKREYDLIHTTDWGLNFIPWAFQNEKPVITNLHGSIGQIEYFDPMNGQVLQSDFIRILEIMTLKKIDELHTHSISNKLFWENILEKNLIYIPPPFSLNTQHKKKRITFDNNPLVVGRIQYWKGPTILCEAMSLLDNSSPTIEWIGRNTTFKSLNQSMNEFLEINYPEIWNKKIITLGQLPYNKVIEYQRSCKFGIVPSIWDMNNFSCLEFMSNGKPVICSKGVGSSEYIENGINGFIYTDNDPNNLAYLISKLNGMKESKLKEMGESALKFVESNLNPKFVATKKIERFEKVISSKKIVSNKKNEWLERLVFPEHGNEDINEYLNNIPLRKLLKHSFYRTIDKFKKL